MLTLALAGRPNVGKSTLFNRLIGQAFAIVEDTPGVTRDWREGSGVLLGMPLRVLDTAGLALDAGRGSLEERATQHALRALRQADVVALVLDGQKGMTADDRDTARILRKHGLRVLVIVNKCEGAMDSTIEDEGMRLGFGAPILVSALHGEGMVDLHAELTRYQAEPPADHTENTIESVTEEENQPFPVDKNQPPLHVAIIGRPNAGKSTLINQLLGYERQLTGAEAGVTRDSIPIAWNWQGRAIRLVDTAGMRRRARIAHALEALSVRETRRAIRLAHVVVLVLDAAMPFDKQDYTLAHEVLNEGRALVLALNKWDTISRATAAKHLAEIRAHVDASLAQAPDLPIVPLSAQTGVGTDALMDHVLKIYTLWETRLPTNALNRWITTLTTQTPPPLVKGRRLKVRYVTQVKARPPTFALWVNVTEDFPETYRRFLTNNLRQTFGLSGVPIRWIMKKSDNPYATKRVQDTRGQDEPRARKRTLLSKKRVTKPRGER